MTSIEDKKRSVKIVGPVMKIEGRMIKALGW